MKQGVEAKDQQMSLPPLLQLLLPAPSSEVPVPCMVLQILTTQRRCLDHPQITADHSPPLLPGAQLHCRSLIPIIRPAAVLTSFTPILLYAQEHNDVADRSIARLY